jgi:hypothetical protein
MISCTEIGIIEEDIPFEGKYVVYGRLQGGTNSINISFTNTFAIDDSTNIEDAALKDLNPYLWSESQGIYPLIYAGEGHYFPVDDLEIKTGDWYELHAKIGKERIFAETYIPPAPVPEEIELIDDYISCKITAEPNSVYGVKYSVYPRNNFSRQFIENSFYEISDPLNNGNEFVTVRTGSLPNEYLTNLEGYRIDLEIYAFDQEYKAYYNSRQNNKPVENIFSEGGGSVFWNVQGENVIGTFIGYTTILESDIIID